MRGLLHIVAHRLGHGGTTFAIGSSCAVSIDRRVARPLGKGIGRGVCRINGGVDHIDSGILTASVRGTDRRVRGILTVSVGGVTPAVIPRISRAGVGD